MQHIVLTLAVGAAVGYLLFRLKFPGGLIVGAIIGTAILNIGFDAAYIPGVTRTIAQITAGSFIGCSVSKADLGRMPRIIRPLLLLIAGYVCLNMAVGFLFLRFVPQLDACTGFLVAVPGGMSDMPVIAADMGADVPQVAVLQFVRMAVGIGAFPAIIARANRAALAAPAPAVQTVPAAPAADTAAPAPRAADRNKGPWVVILTIAVGSAFGFLGKASGIPAGTILFSTLSVLAFKLLTGKAFVPLWLKRVAQVLTGCYVGCYFGMDELLELKYLILPAAVLLSLYIVNCFFMGWFLPKVTHLNRAEAMLIATPAGASDMALISSDIGVDNPDVIFIQILRMIIVITTFPHIINLVLHLIGA